ncbi:MAG: hypothetical protein AB8B55_00515 [Mariniblastus sp.]
MSLQSKNLTSSPRLLWLFAACIFAVASLQSSSPNSLFAAQLDYDHDQNGMIYANDGMIIDSTPVNVCECGSSYPCDCGSVNTSPTWGNLLQLDTPFTSQMLDFQNRQGDKELLLLDHGLHLGGQRSITLGTQFRASGLFAKTNTANKFSYLGRFPADFTGERASDFRLLQANQSVTAHLNSNIHGYFETLFSDVFSFGDFKQGSFQVRQAYVVFGNQAVSPWYAHIGKKNVSFGDMGTLSPFTQAMPWHYFAPLAEGAGIGFDNGRLNATVTALNGSRGIRVVDSEENGDLNNFAANLLLRTPIGNDGQFDIGIGYLHGTIYNADVAEHLDASLFGPNNSAWDVNAHLQMGRMQLAAEYVQTNNAWPATGHEVIAYRTEAALDTYFGGLPGRASVSWSEGLQGEKGTEFEFNRQLVVGYRVQPFENAFFTFEYVRSTGFAPLIGIQRVSDIDVVQNSIVLGAVLSL